MNVLPVAHHALLRCGLLVGIGPTAVVQPRSPPATGKVTPVMGLVRGQEQNCRRPLVRCSKALHQAAKESLIHDLLVTDLLLFARRSGASVDAARRRLVAPGYA